MYIMTHKKNLRKQVQYNNIFGINHIWSMAHEVPSFAALQTTYKLNKL